MRYRLSDDQYQAIYDEINSKIDEIVDTDKEVLTSSWIPGNRWTGTVYEPIDTNCGGDRECSSKFFGLLVWHVFSERPEAWTFKHCEKDGIPIGGATYWRVKKWE